MPKTAFLFPGQGAQTVGMGRQLVESLPAARQLFDHAKSILGYDLAEVCAQGPAERLNATDISHRTGTILAGRGGPVGQGRPPVG